MLIGSAAIAMWWQLPNEAWRQAAYRVTFDTLKFTIPRILVALLGAGFFAELLPAEHMKDLFGQETGFMGLCMAALFGPITPGGAFVSFAIGAAGLTRTKTKIRTRSSLPCRRARCAATPPILPSPPRQKTPRWRSSAPNSPMAA
nr:hypothetical protein [uncultured Cohaesibacter sp.]